MASNSFGNVFKFHSWGSSHGPAIGVMVDGCPAGLTVRKEDIQRALDARRPGQAFTSPRKETDEVEVLSGLIGDKTTGAPLAMMVRNHDANASHYDSAANCFRPGHADYSYQKKYGLYEVAGGGRASARETIARVIAGAIAQSILDQFNVQIHSYVSAVGHIQARVAPDAIDWSDYANAQPALWHPEKSVMQEMQQYLQTLQKKGDSVGGSVGWVIQGSPVGLGDPVYEKLSARIAFGLMSIPATKGVLFGDALQAIKAHGSTFNDGMRMHAGQVSFTSNHAAGLLGGISTGATIFGDVLFKPISSIIKQQATVSHDHKNTVYERPAVARHDPSAMIRAVPIVKAMLQCVLADAVLMQLVHSIEGISNVKGCVRE